MAMLLDIDSAADLRARREAESEDLKDKLIMRGEGLRLDFSESGAASGGDDGGV